MQHIAPSLIFLLLLTAGVSAPRGDEFILSGGGRVEGKLLNPDESPRQKFVIQTADGAKITFDAKQVEKVVQSQNDLQEYQRIQPTYADTAEAQWELAQWCREHHLPQERTRHLQRAIELDPNHAEARHALGYSQVEGQWVTREEVMAKQGYQRYKGQWRLPQEIELLEDKRKLEVAQQEWFQKLKRWRGWLDGDRHEQACENIRSIDDPQAVRALTTALRDDESPPARLLYVAALAKIDTPEAAKALAIASVSDPVEEVRLTCLDHLQTKRRPEVISYYVGKLKDKDNQVVQLAAVALQRMKDPSAVGPLINALITSHKYKIVQPGGDNAMSTSFGSGPGGGGTGMSMGGGPKYVRQLIPNQPVLDALVATTGQNFGFDKQAWKYWFAAQKKAPEAIDARRD